MIELYSSPWRESFRHFVSQVRAELVVAAPFIKHTECEFLCTVLNTSAKVSVLTDIRCDSVMTGALDLSALSRLYARAASTQVHAVPRLHAKVYVADTSKAIITSSNLTPSGLDGNLEYGVAVSDAELVARIRADLSRYARLGSQLDPSRLAELRAIGDKLILDFRRLSETVDPERRREFDDRVREATTSFLAAQVGSRSANSLFSDAITYLLSDRPLRTGELHPRIQQLLPDLCDDSVELVINGDRFGKRWKHAVRNAQQALKRAGAIGFDGTRWHLL